MQWYGASIGTENAKLGSTDNVLDEKVLIKVESKCLIVMIVRCLLFLFLSPEVLKEMAWGLVHAEQVLNH